MGSVSDRIARNRREQEGEGRDDGGEHVGVRLSRDSHRFAEQRMRKLLEIEEEVRGRRPEGGRGDWRDAGHGGI